MLPDAFTRPDTDKLPPVMLPDADSTAVVTKEVAANTLPATVPVVVLATTLSP